MKHRNREFDNFHPIVNFIYFVSVIGFSMFFMHPVLQTIGFLSAFIYSVHLKGKKGTIFNLIILLPIIITTALINPIFNHNGATVLAYFPNGSPLTKESVFYGVLVGLMLATVICFFSCFNEIMTSDKIAYLFGKLSPSLSVIFLMVLRYVPKFKTQIKLTINSQKAIGKDISRCNTVQKAKLAIKIMSSLVGWSLENAIETADSMKSRGYGLSGRTSFSIYKLSFKDILVLAMQLILILIIITLVAFNISEFSIFPYIKYSEMTRYVLILYASYFTLCMLPVIVDFLEVRKWKN